MAKTVRLQLSPQHLRIVVPVGDVYKRCGENQLFRLEHGSELLRTTACHQGPGLFNFKPLLTRLR